MFQGEVQDTPYRQDQDLFERKALLGHALELAGIVEGRWSD